MWQEDILEWVDLERRLDLKDLPQLCDQTIKPQAIALVEAFIDKVTCVCLWDWLHWQTESIENTRTKVLELIRNAWLSPEDFRVNVEEREDHLPMWKTIFGASDPAIQFSRTNDRFWD